MSVNYAPTDLEAVDYVYFHPIARAGVGSLLEAGVACDVLHYAAFGRLDPCHTSGDHRDLREAPTDLLR
jgi:hypothetical protein